MEPQRYLVVLADDFGIGPDTSRGILELAAQGRVTGAVLLVNSPHTGQALRAWEAAGATLEIGWHPCLTLDSPILPAARVPTLVDSTGRFWPLGTFLKRLFFRRTAPAEIEAELRAQLARFVELVGRPPGVINAHQHVNLFYPVGDILLKILGDLQPRPYLRQIREPWGRLALTPGQRGKRLLLQSLGVLLARRQKALGFPGNDWVTGIAAPRLSGSRDLPRWLGGLPGGATEWVCHPGHRDRTLVGRDCGENHPMMQRRVDEFYLLNGPAFPEAVAQAGFTLVPPSALVPRSTRHLHAA